MKKMVGLVVVLAAFAAFVLAAYAWHASGKVFCDENGDNQPDYGDTPIENVDVTITTSGHTFKDSTASDGTYFVFLPPVAAACDVAITAPGRRRSRSRIRSASSRRSRVAGRTSSCSRTARRGRSLPARTRA